MLPSSLARLQPFFRPALAPAPPAVHAAIERVLHFQPTLGRAEKQVAFFGASMAGKSTLINALLGEPLLPTRANRATGVVTGVVTRISHNSLRGAQVLARTSVGPRLLTIPMGEIAGHILLDTSSTWGARASPAPGVEEVRVQLPLGLLRGCVLIDTPGLLDSAALSLNSMREMERADLVVMVLSGEKSLRGCERQATRRANALLGGNVVFVVNRLNTVGQDEWREVMDCTRAALVGVGNALVGQPRVLAVNARGALEARSSGSQPAQASSTDWPRPAGEELLALEKCLARWTGRDGERIALRSRLCILDGLLAQAKSAIGEQLAQARATSSALAARLQEVHGERLARWSESLGADRAELSLCLSYFDWLEETFIHSCVVQAQQLMQRDALWARSLSGCLNGPAREYEAHLSSMVQTALSRGGLAPAPFALSPLYELHSDAALDSQTPVGAAIKFLHARGGEAGGAAGSWFDKGPVGAEARKRGLQSVEHQARALLPTMRAEAQGYIAHVDGLLAAHQAANAPRLQSTPKLDEARAIEASCQACGRWCDEFQNAIREVAASSGSGTLGP